MLANPLFVIISSNQYSKILTRTFNLNLLHGEYKYSIPKIQQSKYRMKKVDMSKESNNSNVVGNPSTSGNTNWDYNCTLENPNVLNQNTEAKSDVNNYNVVFMNPILPIQTIMNPIIPLQTFIPDMSNDMNYCPNTNFFNQFSVPEYFSMHYYHSQQTDERNGHVRSRSSGRRKETDILSKRMWEKTTKKISNKPGFIFTLMSYNVLAQDLLVQHPHLYQYHNKDCLDWNTRWNNLFKEIQKLSPDILCLQEVQESHIKEYFSLLETLGYKSLYKRRTGLRTEGCAVFYKTDIINLVEFTTVEFYQPNISVLNRDNVAIIAKFAPKLHPTREFVIATTHLLYNPKRQDVRLAQMQVLLTEVERISYDKKLQKNDSYLPVIITGDLNSAPDTALYEFLTKGKLKYEGLSPKLLTKSLNVMGKILVPSDLRITDNCQHADIVKKRLMNEKMTRSEELAMIELTNSDRRVEKKLRETENDSKLFSTGTLSHNFIFRSVYEHGEPGNMEGTTYQDEWITVDYIFYSGKKDEPNAEGKLKLLSRYRLPTKQELRGIKIPNSVLGSDHLSIMAKFKLEY